MVEGDSIQALLSEGAFPPRAALEAAAAICDALDTHAPVPGGRPLTATSVSLSAAGEVRLSDVDEVDALAVGTLLAHMLLGARSPAADTDALTGALEAALQGDEIDRGWRRKLLALVRACRSPDPRSRPPIRRVQRRCTDLASGSHGPPLRIFLKRRAASTASWMDLPGAAEQDSQLSQLIASSIPTLTSPGDLATITPPPPRTTPSSVGGPPAHRTLPPPRDSRIPVAIAVGFVLLTAGILYAWPSPTRAPAATTPPPTLRRGGAATSSAVTSGDGVYRLVLASLPEGAEVSVDGSLLGFTPVEAESLDPGVHHILLKTDDERFEQTIMIDRDARCLWEPAGEEPWRCGAAGDPL